MKWLPLTPIAVALIAGAVVHGATTQRWSGVESSAATDALHGYVVSLGDYESEVVPNEIPLKEKSIATCRKYASESRNQTVVVSVITGPPGSVATHTPDVCYVASGYKMLRTPVRETIDLPGVGSASFFTADFEKKSAGRIDRQRVRWAWSADGTWNAPDGARFAYLRVASLAKIYIVTFLPMEANDAVVPDPQVVRQFTAACLVQYHGLFTGRQD